MDIVKARNECILGKTIYDMKLRVADYGRVSTDKDDQINSLENQIKYFNDMISNIKNWTHVASYADEGISGTQVYHREQFLKMIEDARLGKIDLIVTKEVSRFARNTVDSIRYTQLLLSYGVLVYFISDNINTLQPDSEFRLTLMASMAQDEVRKLSERVKFGIKRSIKDEKVGGGAPYGYIKKSGKLYINEEETPIVRKIYSLYLTEEYGLKKIGEMLAEEGHYTSKGNVFSDITLKKMIINPKYKGWYTAGLSEVEDYKTHKKILKPREEWICYKDTKGSVPAIVSEEIWDRAYAIYKKRNSLVNKNVLNHESFIGNRKYTSKFFCLEHNTTFIRTANGKRKNNPVWQCNEFLRHGIKGCLTPRLYEKHLDEIFSSMIEKLVDNKDDLINTITNDYINLIKESSNIKDLNILNDKLKERQMFKDKLIDMSLRNLITEEDFLEKTKKLNEEISNIKKDIIKLESMEQSEDYYSKMIKKIKNAITPSLDVRNNIGKYFDLFIDKVFVSKVDNDRKHIKLQVLFNFNREDEEIELDFNNYDDNNHSGLNNMMDMQSKKNTTNCSSYNKKSLKLFFLSKSIS